MGGPLWAYIWAGVKLIIATSLILLLLTLEISVFHRPINAVLYALPAFIKPIGLFLLSIAVSWLGLRLTAFSPGVATDKAIGLLDGFAETHKISGAIFVAALIVVVISTGGTYLLNAFAKPALGLNVIYLSVVLSWLQLMLYISLLTTICGHSVEGPPLRT